MADYSNKLLVIGCVILGFVGGMVSTDDTKQRVKKVEAEIKKIKNHMMEMESASAVTFKQLEYIDDSALDYTACCPHAGMPVTAEAALHMANVMYAEIIKENTNDIEKILASFATYLSDVEKLQRSVKVSFLQTCQKFMGKRNERCETTAEDMKKHRFAVETDALNWNTESVCATKSPIQAQNCADLVKLHSQPDGIHYVEGPDGKPLKVYCDAKTETGGWTVILRRNGDLNNVDFDVSFEDYERGFGDYKGEFWLGLNKTAYLTRNDTFALLVEMEDYEARYATAEYREFKITDSSDGFRLVVSRYTGTAGDSLTYHNMMEFSTKEIDNDKSYDENCAEIYHSGWWFNDCFNANLHGLHGKDPLSDDVGSRMRWRTFTGYTKALKKAEMKIRPRCY